jgi:uncharacterized protein YndB with AHSA1/START domain
MNKYKFTEEFELNASPRVIFPYLQNPASLAEWFADKVALSPDKVFNFIWDNTDHFAKLVATRQNKQIKYEFLDKNLKSVADPNFIEFKLQQSELTNTTFLKITDYSDMTSPDDLDALWKGLINQLKEVLGS